MKHIYRSIVLVIIFVLSVLYFGKNIQEQTIDFNTTVKMGKATFPTVTIRTGDVELNRLHGYTSNIDANVIRESIIALDSAGSFEVLIDENETNVKKLDYEIRNIASDEVVDEGSISALEKEKDRKIAKIKIKTELEREKEYSLKITIKSDVNKKIYFYSRVKYLDEAKLTEKLAFVTNFHESTFDKEKAKDLQQYLESDPTVNQNTLATVTIKSSLDLISWGKLSPTIVSDVVPTVIEINGETIAVEFQYVISAKTDSGEETYQVKEFYRIRWTEEKVYLLYYERSMEAVFDLNLTKPEENKIKIGITNSNKIDLTSSLDNKKICFVRNGELWYYNVEDNKAVKVFSFLHDNIDYVRDAYDQHDIRILSMDEEGNIDFMVYGYMNRGDYEGRVAIVLYHFYSAQNRIEEQVYVPMDMPYQILKEGLDSFSYVSSSDVFYFSMNNVIYAYDIITKSVEVIVSDITSDDFLMSMEGRYIAWQNSKDPKKATEITILNLETKERKIITAPAENNIKILGKIDTNFVYGYVKTKDIITTKDGSTVVPLYQVEIADGTGAVLKEYAVEGNYVTEVAIKDNIIELSRVKKASSGNRYETAEKDYILNEAQVQKKSFEYVIQLADKALTEAYLTVPKEIVMKKLPKVSNTVNTIITVDTTLNLMGVKAADTKYYVYAVGSIMASFTNAADAIILADEKMGTVIGSNNQIIWARGGKVARSTISGMKENFGGNGSDSIGACLSMLLSYNNISVPASDLSSQSTSMFAILQDNLKKTPVNMTGCTLDEVLYYVSERRPVIGMKDANNAVLIIAYDEYNVTVIDPNLGKSMKMGLNSASDMFEAAGNVFLSYVE